MTCRLCVRTCPVEAIVIENNLPKIDQDKCVKCLACVKKCPTHALVAHGKEVKINPAAAK